MNSTISGPMADDDLPDTLASRRHQMFPVLTDAEIARIRRFGEVRRYERGDAPVRRGRARSRHVRRAEGRRRRSASATASVTSCPIASQGPGQFLGEVAQLSGRHALVDGYAEDDVETLLVPPEQLRALIIAEADLGERIVRALILRRVGLIESGASGPVLIGEPQSAASAAPADVPASATATRTTSSTPSTMHAAAALLEQYGAAHGQRAGRLPQRLGAAQPVRGRARPLPRHARYRRRTTSSSTSSWSAPDRRASPPPSTRPRKACASSCSIAASFGGQAGASARIENYLGFPTGISGQALAGRAFVQAQKFGAEILIPAQAAALDCSRAGPDGELAVDAHRRTQAAVAHGRDRQRRALSPARRAAPRRVRGPRRLVLGVGARSEDVRASRSRAGRRRQLGRPGGRVSGAARLAASTCWCAGPASPPACRAT